MQSYSIKYNHISFTWLVEDIVSVYNNMVKQTDPPVVDESYSL